MAATTIAGAINGTSFTFLGSTPAQVALAQALIASATGATATLVTGAGGAITTGTTIAIGAGSVLTGVSSVALTNVVLDGPSETYFTGAAPFSQVVAADGANATIVNNNPTGGLVAETGAGANQLLGLAGVNAFTTGIGGNDTVILDGVANSLTSNGSDAVLVGGPSTVTAAANGVDNISMTSTTTLAFINGSKAGVVDTVTGAGNSTITLAGTGSTSVTSGIGTETFNIDTSAGNVTLNGSAQADTFEFIKDANVATGMVTVNNIASGSAIDVHGYAGYSIATQTGNAAGSVLTLSDGSQVTFSNVSAATLTSTIKVV